MRTFVFFIGGVVLAASTAFGQTPRPERPYRGLFGGGIGATDQSLIFNAGFGGGYSDTIRTSASQTVGLNDSLATRSGSFEQASLGLAYNVSRQRVSFFASGAVNAAYFSAGKGSLVQSESGSAGASVQIAKRTGLSITETISYQPLLFSASIYGLPDQAAAQTAAQAAVVDQDAGAGLQRVVTSNTAVALSQGLTKRMSLALYYLDGRTGSAAGGRNYSIQSGGARLTTSLTKGLGLRVGYGFSGGFYGSSQRFRNGIIDAGLDFNRALSISRRMTLSFGTGVAAVGYGTQTEYTAIGSATLNREIGRTWNASATFRRNVSMFQTLGKPAVYDAAMFGVNGLLSTRVSFQSTVGAALGKVGSDQSGNNFRNYFGTAGVTFGMTRLLAFGLDYIYYRYTFDTGVTLPLGFATWADRQTFLATTKLWLPLLTKTRRLNATR